MLIVLADYRTISIIKHCDIPAFSGVNQRGENHWWVSDQHCLITAPAKFDHAPSFILEMQFNMVHSQDSGGSLAYHVTSNLKRMS